MWFPSTRTTPKPRFAAPGSMPITTCMDSDSRNPVGCLPEKGGLSWRGRGTSARHSTSSHSEMCLAGVPRPRPSQLSHKLLQHVRRDVEVRVDLVDVVLVVERVEQAEDPLSVVAFHFDAAFRLRDQPCGLDLDAFAFERLPDGSQGGQLADHPQLAFVLAYILGTG